MHLAQNTVATKLSGEFSVRILELRPHERYPQELFIVSWSLKAPCGHVVRQEFSMRYADHLFCTFGVKCYRDTGENSVANQTKIAELLLGHFHVFEYGRDIQIEVVVVFSEDTKGERAFCRVVYWSHLDGLRAQA